MSLHLAAASYIYVHYALKKRKKQQRWWQTQLYTNRKVYSGSSLLRDLSFQPVSGLYKHFTKISPTEFEFLINLMLGIPYYWSFLVLIDEFYYCFLAPLHSNTTTLHHSVAGRTEFKSKATIP
jgi:hypothetical protein